MRRGRKPGEFSIPIGAAPLRPILGTERFRADELGPLLRFPGYTPIILLSIGMGEEPMGSRLATTPGGTIGDHFTNADPMVA